MTTSRQEVAVNQGAGPAHELLVIDNLSASYAGQATRARVLENVSFAVHLGEFVTVVGPSGTGKTTLLRCMAGLMRPDDGQVRMRGALVDRPPANLAVVFQDYSRSLMPWLTVHSNVTLPLRRLKLSRAEMRERGTRALRAVGLEDAGDLHPWQLSGGMQQRVAIARAVAYEPEALLMDEPFASVDAQTRADLEDLILDVRARLGVTVVLVTHDIDEAVYLADRVIVLKGRPATVTRELSVPLGAPRDQLETKARPEFVSLRSAVLSEIRTPQPTREQPTLPPQAPASS